MSIDEAIKNAEEKAEDLRKEGIGIIKQNRNNPDKIVLADRCIKYAEEHEQLAEWLKNYKRLLKSIKSSVMNYADIIGEDLAHQIIFDIMDDIEENY